MCNALKKRQTSKKKQPKKHDWVYLKIICNNMEVITRLSKIDWYCRDKMKAL